MSAQQRMSALEMRISTGSAVPGRGDVQEVEAENGSHLFQEVGGSREGRILDGT